MCEAGARSLALTLSLLVACGCLHCLLVHPFRSFGGSLLNSVKKSLLSAYVPCVERGRFHQLLTSNSQT